MNIQFQYPQLLWSLALLPVLLLLWVWWRWRRRKAVQRMGDARLTKTLLQQTSPGRQTIRFIVASLAFALGCLALANPRRQDATVMDVRKGIDIVIALDVSNSMLATEGSLNRLQTATNALLGLVQRSANDRIGLVLFAGNAYMQMPLTFDRGAAQLFLSSASPEAIKAQGTAIGEALDKAAAAFDRESERFQTIVLVTDGETHDEGALERATELAQKGIVINAVGIGSPQGTTLIDPVLGTARLDAGGNVIVTKLNKDFLQQLARATNGSYFHLTGNDNAVVSSLTQSFAQIEGRGMADTSQATYQTLYLWALVPMAFLLLIEIFIPARKRNAA